MPRVRILPAGAEFEVGEGEAVAEAAWRHGHVWPTQCWGQADCMTCFTRIVDGELCALPAEREELDAVRAKMSPRFRSDPLVRLACRLRCQGDGLVLEKQGFRAAEPAESGGAD
ncbi:2Fe-2S iron-sulfur cluster-binding protein [Actinocorallia sp. A-T 12471]|uniref:2Fe-2S iron-sulfur cluster-binding protein n=1 Tax=Actinocorallia sp. A-T 12471 TaxID=3089813 RepID=UPI0029CFF606|nr:2Fe-2S iron-sulfur cluster-binding protein [Actinocorallia sp. A-T 12471]MDX6740168.1 2Fe-2S iron-sulfur cluster-binding protein [Actinocorallia sp. A-T 12471]